MGVLTGKVVLLVDDESELLEIMAEDVLRLGGEPIAAADAAAALLVLRDRRVDIVVSDLRMPGIDGMQLLGRIRTAISPIPVLVLATGFFDAEIARNALQMAIIVIRKPLDPEELARLVGERLA